MHQANFLTIELIDINALHCLEDKGFSFSFVDKTRCHVTLVQAITANLLSSARVPFCKSCQRCIGLRCTGSSQVPPSLGWVVKGELVNLTRSGAHEPGASGIV